MHHAYLYEGPLSLLADLARSAQQLLTGTEGANPDVHVFEHEKFSIEEARELSAQAALKNVSNQSLYVLGTGAISPEAQQAMLKLFEEPQQGMVFVLLTPKGTLMPTLRSRFLEYPEKLEAQAVSLAPAKKFLASAYKERSTQVAALIKEEEGAKERVREFITSLELLLHTAHTKNPSAELREALEDIALVRGYLGDRSASLKMLLEHLAATLPLV